MVYPVITTVNHGNAIINLKNVFNLYSVFVPLIPRSQVQASPKYAPDSSHQYALSTVSGSAPT